MSYVPEWESLAQSLARLASPGSDEQKIKTDLCHAIADQKIELRAFLSDDDEDLPGHCFTWKEIHVPRRLKSTDFNWDDYSLPIKDWFAGDPNNVNIGWERRKFEELQLRTHHVNTALKLADAARPPESKDEPKVEAQKEGEGKPEDKAAEAKPDDARLGKANAAGLIESASKAATIKLSKSAKTAKFKEWREGRGDNVPKVEEDEAYMKQFNVGRDEVRKLRKGYPSLKRGRPKTA